MKPLLDKSKGIACYKIILVILDLNTYLKFHSFTLSLKLFLLVYHFNVHMLYVYFTCCVKRVCVCKALLVCENVQLGKICLCWLDLSKNCGIE